MPLALELERLISTAMTATRKLIRNRMIFTELTPLSRLGFDCVRVLISIIVAPDYLTYYRRTQLSGLRTVFPPTGMTCIWNRALTLLIAFWRYAKFPTPFPSSILITCIVPNWCLRPLGWVGIPDVL